MGTKKWSISSLKLRINNKFVLLSFQVRHNHTLASWKAGASSLLSGPGRLLEVLGLTPSSPLVGPKDQLFLQILFEGSPKILSLYGWGPGWSEWFPSERGTYLWLQGRSRTYGTMVVRTSFVDLFVFVFVKPFDNLEEILKEQRRRWRHSLREEQAQLFWTRRSSPPLPFKKAH